MRSRFGRGRRSRGPAERKAEPIDAERSFQQLLESGCIPAESLDTVDAPGVAAHFAALGSGQTASGARLIVGKDWRFYAEDERDRGGRSARPRERE